MVSIHLPDKTFISIMLDRRTPAVSAEATAGLRSIAGGTPHTVVCSPEPSEQSGRSKRARGRGPPIIRCTSDVSHVDGIETQKLHYVVLVVAAYSIIIILNTRSSAACRVRPNDVQSGHQSAIDASGQDDCP